MEGRASESLVAQLGFAMSFARPGERVLRLNLFGIQHADRLRGVNLGALVEDAGFGRSLAAEVRRGVRLAGHVQAKQRPTLNRCENKPRTAPRAASEPELPDQALDALSEA